MTPLPKNLAIIKAIFGIFNAGIRLDRTGKNAPVIITTTSFNSLTKGTGCQNYEQCTDV
jgi:hypothetical protein